MAHFAEIDSNGIVLRVVVGCNQDVINNGGEQSKQAAEVFKNVCPLSSNGVEWVQTSYHANFRKRFAGRGNIYLKDKDIFITAQPYSSWTLDENGDWQAPIAKPENYHPLAKWDESNQTWIDYIPGV